MAMESDIYDREFDINKSMIKYCKKGNIKMVLKLIELGANEWDSYLEPACASGNLDIVKLIDKKCPKLNWTIGLIGACYTSNIEILNYVVTKSKITMEALEAAYIISCFNKNFNIATIIMNSIQLKPIILFTGACQLGDINKVQMLLQNPSIDINAGFVAACSVGNMDIIDLLLSKGANNWNRAFIVACNNNQRKVMDLLISKGANNWDAALEISCNADVIDFLIKKGAKSWTPLMIESIKNMRTEIIKKIIDKPIDINKCLLAAIDMNDIYTAKLLIEKGAVISRMPVTMERRLLNIGLDYKYILNKKVLDDFNKRLLIIQDTHFIISDVCKLVNEYIGY